MALQYPHTGRTSCIHSIILCIGLPSGIAVPSHGSNFMHLTRGGDSGATGRVIAVPSHGSNFMHHIEKLVRRAICSYCSTLTRVELHASTRTVHPRSSSTCIAVPSHGSNFMHPSPPLCRRRCRRNCSTLTRVELHASGYYRVTDKDGNVLQYPHTGRTSCISPTSMNVALLKAALQYPHTGRTSCI